MGAESPRVTYRFADCELDEARYELRRRGEVVELAPKSLHLLHHLVRHHDRMVSRDELLEALWPDVVVSDAALATTIKHVRRAVGDLGSRQDVIATRRGVGLRMVAAVERVEAPRETAAPSPPAEPEAGSASKRPARDPFVGRTGARGLLEQLVREIPAGRGRLAVVEGEPGVGKTALVEETARFAEARGVEVIRSYCWDGEGAPPLWLWTQVLEPLVGTAKPEELETWLGPAAPWIALILPSLRLRRPDLATPDLRGGDGEEGCVELFDAIANVLGRAACARGGLVLLLEDVHWAGPGAIRALRYLAARIGPQPLLVLVTRRPSAAHAEPGPGDALSGLVAGRSTEWIPLEGLPAEDLAELVESWTGAPPAEAAVAALGAGTRGNPLLAREVVRALLAAGADLDEALPAAFASAGLLAAAPALRRILRHRVGQLSASARAVLETASVIGMEPDLALLCHATSRPAREVLSALDESSEAHVTEPVGGADERFRFVHALFREALLESLTLSRRTELHRRVGEALEVVHAADPDAVLEALAHHFGRAAPILDDLRAFDWARRAGDRAAAILAYEDAALWFETARRALDLQPRPDPERRAQILIRLGSTFLSTWQARRARSTFREAAAAARHSGNAPLLATAAFGFAGVQLGTPSSEGILLLEEAIAALGPADSPARVWGMTVLLVQRASQEGASVRLRQQAAETTAMAQRLGDASTQVMARAAEAIVERNLPDDDPDARRRRLGEAGEIARRAGDPWLRMAAGLQEISACLESGRLPEAEQILARLEEGGRTRSSYLSWVAPGFRAMRAATRGLWEEALELAQAAYARSGTDLDDGVSLGAVRAHVDCELARSEGAVPGIARLASQHGWNPYLRAALARALLDSGQRAAAQAEVDGLAAGGFGPLVGRDSWRAALWLLTEVCAGLGDLPRLEALREHLLRSRRRCALVRNLALCPGPVSHALGVAAASLGRADEACEWFEEAAALGLEAGAPAWTARARAAHAGVLRQQNGRGDDARVEALLRGAESCLETEPWPRLDALLRALRAAPPRIASAPASRPLERSGARASHGGPAPDPRRGSPGFETDRGGP